VEALLDDWTGCAMIELGHRERQILEMSLWRKSARAGYDAGIPPENTGRQIAVLEVAGSSPVGHPH
jgi:hypothetical protein